MSASRTINLRSRVVETTEAVPELGYITPVDTGSDNRVSERAVSPAPGTVESRRLDNVSVPRHPSLDNEMEDLDSPTRRFGFGRSESGLVSDPEVSTGIIKRNRIMPRKLSWNQKDFPPHLSRRGRGKSGVRFRPMREYAKLSDEQLATVAAAEATMTSDERARIVQRDMSDATSRGEGPSHNKGKGNDPREFGGIDFAPDEDDPEIQLALLKAYKEEAEKRILEAEKRLHTVSTRETSVRRSNDTSRVRESRTPGQNDASVPVEHPADRGRSVLTDQRRSTPYDRNIGVMPSDVLHPKSTIARSLLKGGRMSKEISGGGDDSDDSSSSDSSSSDSDTSDPYGYEGNSGDDNRNKRVES
jgi:hypothetical protein